MMQRRLLRAGLGWTGLLCAELLLGLAAFATELLAVNKTAPVESALTFERRTPDTTVTNPDSGADQTGANNPRPASPIIRALDAFVPSREVDTDKAVDFPTNI